MASGLGGAIDSVEGSGNDVGDCVDTAREGERDGERGGVGGLPGGCGGASRAAMICSLLSRSALPAMGDG